MCVRACVCACPWLLSNQPEHTARTLCSTLTRKKMDTNWVRGRRQETWRFYLGRCLLATGNCLFLFLFIWYALSPPPALEGKIQTSVGKKIKLTPSCSPKEHDDFLVCRVLSIAFLLFGAQGPRLEPQICHFLAGAHWESALGSSVSSSVKRSNKRTHLSGLLGGVKKERT